MNLLRIIYDSIQKTQYFISVKITFLIRPNPCHDGFYTRFSYNR